MRSMGRRWTAAITAAGMITGTGVRSGGWRFPVGLAYPAVVKSAKVAITSPAAGEGTGAGERLYSNRRSNL
jgi:hypothetical protein